MTRVRLLKLSKACLVERVLDLEVSLAEPVSVRRAVKVVAYQARERFASVALLLIDVAETAYIAGKRIRRGIDPLVQHISW